MQFGNTVLIQGGDGALLSDILVPVVHKDVLEVPDREQVLLRDVAPLATLLGHVERAGEKKDNSAGIFRPRGRDFLVESGYPSCSCLPLCI